MSSSIFRADLFKSKVAIVTGGGTGIGFCIANELASLGATVVIVSRNIEKCLKAQELAASRGIQLFVPPNGMSLKDEKSISQLVSYVVATFKKIDILVNNAGGQFVSPANKISARGFSGVIDTNLKGTFLVCKHVYNASMKVNGGNIVNITLGNRNGMPSMSHSGAARAGVENLTKTLACEWIHSRVRINCVRPGIIYTKSGMANYGNMADTLISKILPSIPAKRLGTAEEISSATVFLLSDGAAYITGQALAVDGGGSFTFLPLIKIKDKEHLAPYGELPQKARL